MNSHKDREVFRAHFHETRQNEQQYVKNSHTEFHTNREKRNEKLILKESVASMIFTKLAVSFAELSYNSFHSNRKKTITKFYGLSNGVPL